MASMNSQIKTYHLLAYLISVCMHHFPTLEGCMADGKLTPNHTINFDSPKHAYSLVMHPQFLAGLKCESQTENNGRTRSRNMFLGSQHYKGVEGCAGVPGWD
jgi:hypothetical protein